MARVYSWVKARRIALCFCALALLGMTAGLWALADNGDPWPWRYELLRYGDAPREMSFAEAKEMAEWEAGEELNMVGTAGAWAEMSAAYAPIEIPLTAFEGPPPPEIAVAYDFTLSFSGYVWVTKHVSGVRYYLSYVWEYGAVYEPLGPGIAQWGSEQVPDPTLSEGLAHEFEVGGEDASVFITLSTMVRVEDPYVSAWKPTPTGEWWVKANFLYEFKAAPNAPPTAVVNATPTVGDAPLTVSFNGLDSFDTDGTIVDYTWIFGDGTSASGPVVSHPYNNPNNYTARLIVTDDKGDTGTASILITVNQPNLPPIAAATATPAVVLLGKPIRFNSTGSSDPEGGALTYSWDFGDNTTSTLANPTHTYDQPKDYAVTLTVKDPQGAQAVATVKVKVVAVDTLVVEPALATLLSEQKQQFTAKGIWYGPDGTPDTLDDEVNDVTSLVSWRVESREAGALVPGTITNAGLFTAEIPAGDDRRLRGFVVASLALNAGQIESRAEVDVWKPKLGLEWTDPAKGSRPEKTVVVGTDTSVEAAVTYSTGPNKDQPWDFNKHGALDYEWTVTYTPTGETTTTVQNNQVAPPKITVNLPKVGKYLVELAAQPKIAGAYRVAARPAVILRAFGKPPPLPDGQPLAINLKGAAGGRSVNETLEFEMWMNPKSPAQNGLDMARLTPAERFNVYDTKRGYVRAAVVVSTKAKKGLTYDAIKKAFDDFEVGRTKKLTAFDDTFVVPAFYIRESIKDPIKEPKDEVVWRWRARIFLPKPGKYFFYACVRVKPQGVLRPAIFPNKDFPVGGDRGRKWTHKNYAVSRYPQGDTGLNIQVGTAPKPGMIYTPDRVRGGKPRFFHRMKPDGSGLPLYLTGMCRFANLRKTDKHWITPWHSGWVDTKTEVLDPLHATNLDPSRPRKEYFKHRKHFADLLSIWLLTADSSPVHSATRAGAYNEEWNGLTTARRAKRPVPFDPGEKPYQHYDQGRAKMLDDLLSAADERGVGVMMTIWGHPDLRVNWRWNPELRPSWFWTNGNWGHNGANQTNPWYLLYGNISSTTSLKAFVAIQNDGRTANYQKNYYRYLIARYSGYRALALWEGISEYEGISGVGYEPIHGKDDIRIRFANEIGKFFKATDPYRHPYSCSSSGYKQYDYLAGDYASTHAYGRLWNGTGSNQPKVMKFENNAKFRVSMARDVASQLPTKLYNTAVAKDMPWFHGEHGLVERTSGDGERHQTMGRDPDPVTLALTGKRIFKGITAYHYVLMHDLIRGAAGTPLKWNDAKEFGEMKARAARPGTQDYCKYFENLAPRKNYPPNYFDALQGHKRLMNTLIDSGVTPWSMTERDFNRATTKAVWGMYARNKGVTVFWIFRTKEGDVPADQRKQDFRKYKGQRILPKGNWYSLTWVNPWTGKTIGGAQVISAHPAPKDPNKEWIGSVNIWDGKMASVIPQGFVSGDKKPEDILVIVKPFVKPPPGGAKP